MLFFYPFLSTQLRIGEYTIGKFRFELWSSTATQTKLWTEAISCFSNYLESDSRVLAAAANLIRRPEASSAIHPLALVRKSVGTTFSGSTYLLPPHFVSISG
ncbi:hypothetical protein NPIL_233761 [Nephila pilipes]|uniref:Uncharacterized protein n=1 Tax=Nephila pilipes TaxID=299642 RepID=A0A8X6PQR5_NEPPI|nr:hypothetical protein NPIL_233761 [Nephila pilipes]